MKMSVAEGVSEKVMPTDKLNVVWKWVKDQGIAITVLVAVALWFGYVNETTVRELINAVRANTEAHNEAFRKLDVTMMELRMEMRTARRNAPPPTDGGQ